MRLQRITNFLYRDRRSPFIINQHRFTAAAHHVLSHAFAKHAIAADDDFVPRLNQVNKAGLHTCTARCRDGNRKLIVGLKGVFEQLLEFVHHLDKKRVKVAHRRAAQSLQYLWGNIGWTRAHQNTTRGDKTLVSHWQLLLNHEGVLVVISSP